MRCDQNICLCLFFQVIIMLNLDHFPEHNQSKHTCLPQGRYENQIKFHHCPPKKIFSSMFYTLDHINLSLVVLSNIIPLSAKIFPVPLSQSEIQGKFSYMPIRKQTIMADCVRLCMVSLSKNAM